jgi:hypothetical protein
VTAEPEQDPSDSVQTANRLELDYPVVSRQRPPTTVVAETDDPTELDSEDARLAHLEELSWLFDNSVPVPGTDYRIGLDPILGLLPVLGDVPGATVSAYIVAEAAAMGVPRETLARMGVNLVLDATLGSLPVVGDLFDAVWKANERNVRLLTERVDDPDAGTADRRFLLAVTAGLLVCLLAVGAGTTLAVLWLLGQAGITL